MHAPGSPWLGTTKRKPPPLLQLAKDIGLPPFDPAVSRASLDECGFRISRRIGDPADYVIARAFIKR